MKNSSRKLINVGSRQLHAFLEIARLQSFAKAAEQIHLSPSGISMLVKELENQVGAGLFHRTTRSVTLTDAGRRLQPVAQRILRELFEIEDVLGSSEAAIRSRINVAATPMVSASLLPDVIRAFDRSHPQVQINLADVDVSVVRQKILEREADIGLGFFIKPDIGLVRQPLCKFRLMRISPPGSGAAGLRSSQAWGSLAALPLIGLPIDNPIQALIEKHLARIGRGNEEHPRMNLIGTIIAMVRAGRGHAIIPSFALEECIRQGLTVAMLSNPAVHIDLHVVTLRGTKLQTAAVDFVAALKKAASRKPG